MPKSNSKPKCGKGQSCGFACIEIKDTCSEKISPEDAAMLAGVAAQLPQLKQKAIDSFNQSDSDLDFDQLAAKYPFVRGTGVETETKLGSGVSLYDLTMAASDGSGDMLTYSLVLAKGRSFTVSDGMIKEFTASDRGGLYKEALAAAIRAKVDVNDNASTNTNYTIPKEANLDLIATQEYSQNVAGDLYNLAQDSDIIGISKKSSKTAFELIDSIKATKTYPHILSKDIYSSNKPGYYITPAGVFSVKLDDFGEPEAWTVPEYYAKAVINANDRQELHSSAVKAIDNANYTKLVSVTDSLWDLEDEAYDRKPKPDSTIALHAMIKDDAVAWAKSQGFKPGGVNGFTAQQTAAHDVAHPATHRLTRLDSKQIHKVFSSMIDSAGRPSLLAEEALVNAVEHLSMGDTPQASVLNGLRLAKVLSRTQSAEAQAYVRGDEFARGLLDIVHSRVLRNNDYKAVMQLVRDNTIISGTVTASGNDFTNSASGG